MRGGLLLNLERLVDQRPHLGGVLVGVHRLDHAGGLVVLEDGHRLAAVGVEARLEMITKEMGEPFLNGITPSFATARVRIYDSYWNWV